MIEAMWEATKVMGYAIGIGLMYAAVVGAIIAVGVIAMIKSFWLAVGWAVFVVWCLLVCAYKWGMG
jgi:hypothetical protein